VIYHGCIIAWYHGSKELYNVAAAIVVAEGIPFWFRGDKLNDYWVWKDVLCQPHPFKQNRNFRLFL